MFKRPSIHFLIILQKNFFSYLHILKGLSPYFFNEFHLLFFSYEKKIVLQNAALLQKNEIQL